MSERKFLSTDLTDGIATVTLRREPLNILNLEMMGELDAALESLRAQQPAALVLRAEGKAFCAGVDVADHTAGKVREMIERFHAIFRHLLTTDALTIAAVQGAALGGGCELACACDIVLASTRAKFGQPEVRLGVFPPVAACVLPLRVGLSRAVELCAAGRTIDAETAAAIGLANHVFDAGAFDAKVGEYLDGIRACSRPVVRLAKRATIAAAREALLEQLREAERLYLDELMTLSDAHVGIAAFLEKRKPVWRHA